MAYYLKSGKLWSGKVHRMGGQIHTGAKHSKSSKPLLTKKPK